MNGMSEQQLAELYEIYKEQQKLRNKLEEQLSDKMGTAERALMQQTLREMQRAENELLRNGVTQQTMNRMNRIQQRLLQLQGAAFQQEREQQRTSNTNKETFSGEERGGFLFEGEQKKEQEELIRKPLPMTSRYKNLIKKYFQDRNQRK